MIFNYKYNVILYMSKRTIHLVLNKASSITPELILRSLIWPSASSLAKGFRSTLHPVNVYEEQNGPKTLAC